MPIDVLEQGKLDLIKLDLTEKLDNLHQSFVSKVKPVHGLYGEPEVLKDNGMLVKIFKNEQGHTFKEYYRDGKILEKFEILSLKENRITKFDDYGTPYLKITKSKKNNIIDKKTAELRPNTKIRLGKFTSETDQYGRLKYTEMEDVKLTGQKHKNVERFDNQPYRKGDQASHGVPNMVGGPNDASNIVPQTERVNLSTMKRVEGELKRLVEDGHSVKYRENMYYVGTDKRPYYFVPEITVDGKYHELPEDLRKIYNNGLSDKINDKIVAFDRKFGAAHELGMKSGLTAAGLTLAISSAENISAFADGKISGEEMASNIVEQTAAAGALGYGSTFITASVSQAMSGASSELLRKVGGSCLPVAAVSFVVDSYGSISEFAQGKMDGAELAYDLGDSAASVAGGIAGSALSGMALGSVAGPVGAVVGFVGGVAGGAVGCALASEAYATAVELGSEGADMIAEYAQQLASETSELVKETAPEKFDEVKSAFEEFFAKTKLR